jgi:type IV secretion system protein VirD4
LVLTAALDEMTDTLNPPPLPVCFMLDELATLGHLSVVENAIGLSAGYGVQIFTVFQDTAQMKDLYRGRWASFVGNAGIRALFNLDDYETAKYWSDTIGGSLVQTKNMQQDIYGFSKSQSVGETMRPLISPEEMMRHLAQDKMLVLPQGSRPIISDRVPYYEDTELTGLWDDPRTSNKKA